METAEAAGRGAGSLKTAPICRLRACHHRFGAKNTGASSKRSSSELAGKRILVRAGGQSSLEFHVEKRETY